MLEQFSRTDPWRTRSPIERVLFRHGVGPLRIEQNRPPRDPKAIEAILRDIRKANAQTKTE